MAKTKRKIIILAVSLLVGLCDPLAAEPEHEHEHEQHEAHVHGEARLLIALEGNTLQIEFLSPAMNIVGFEHLPQNKTQSRTVELAIETLKQPGLLFILPPSAECDPVSIEVESSLAHHHENEEESKEEGHSDFRGQYYFLCQDISRLGNIGVEIFKRFPGTRLIEVQSISKSGQQKIDLTPDQNALVL
jgi:hypothetical protein